MVTDQQIRRLWMYINSSKTKVIAADRAGMDPKTARKYLKSGKLPSQLKKDRTWHTRKNPFIEDWPEIKKLLELNPRLEAKTIFDSLQRENSGKYQDSQLRTLQRKIKTWRATAGPAKEVFFPQVHFPGQLGQSDFTYMTKLGIMVKGQLFEHMIYHFVLSYSNWETGMVCFSESYESLSEGLQNALWKLGGVPLKHRTDRMSAAVNKECNPEEFTERYQGLLRHYGLHGEKINTGKANEDGDIEQRHHRFKRALDQALMLRDSRDFVDVETYKSFLRVLFKQLNNGRRERFEEELKLLRDLPQCRLDDCKRVKARVNKSSTVRVQHNTYSVNSRLIGEWVEARIHAQEIEVWYAQRCVDKVPRLKGRGHHNIQYRHIINWLVRKPGAFKDYRYHTDLFPSSYFRISYDQLSERHCEKIASKEYLKILYLAAKESESKVEAALRQLITFEQPISADAVKNLLNSDKKLMDVTDINVAPVNVCAYDTLLEEPIYA